MLIFLGKKPRIHIFWSFWRRPHTIISTPTSTLLSLAKNWLQGVPGIQGKKNYRILGTEPFFGRKWESEICIFNRKVGNACFCTMGTLEIATIPEKFFWGYGIGHFLSLLWVPKYDKKLSNFCRFLSWNA